MPYSNKGRVRDLLRHGAQILEKAGVDAPAFDARELLLSAAGLRKRCDLDGAGLVDEEIARRYEELIRRRAARYPLQYLLGFWEFYGREFFVDERVLIPRPDTELLIDTAKQLLSGGGTPSLLDLCSGSGAVALTLALELPQARVDALELSPPSLEILQKNNDALEAGVRILAGDVVTFAADRTYEMILSNPPYIREADYAALQPEVAYEPKMALTAGADGLFFYRAIIARYREAIAPGGVLLLEAGVGQAPAIAGLMADCGYDRVFVRKDYGGIDRVVGGFRPR